MQLGRRGERQGKAPGGPRTCPGEPAGRCDGPGPRVDPQGQRQMGSPGAPASSLPPLVAGRPAPCLSRTAGGQWSACLGFLVSSFHADFRQLDGAQQYVGFLTSYTGEHRSHEGAVQASPGLLDTPQTGGFQH